MGREVYHCIVMDVIDGHFVEYGDGVFIGGVFGGFEDDLEPGGVGPSFFVQDDVADAFEIRGFHLLRVVAFIIIDLIIFGEEESDHGGFRDRLLVDGWCIFRQDEGHGPWPAHRGGEYKEGDQQEAEVYHRGKVHTRGELFAFFHAGAFFLGAAGGV